MSNWWNLYVANPNTNNERFRKKFRTRFRLPYESFMEIVEMLEEHSSFKRWHNGKTDAVNNPCAPLTLLTLCALRYLGRGLTFDDCEESTAISREVVRVFFHVFIEWGSTVLYKKWVIAPSTKSEILDNSHEYTKAGFPGCVGSTDATHILLERVCYRLRQAHLGFKLSHTARTYNLTVNHRQKILYTTSGHPARWNDKTLVLFDEFVNSLNNGELDSEATFELYEYTPAGEIVRRKYRGAWLIVDNGYLDWSVTIPPMKTTDSRKEIRFSAWLESMRKDVECTFGILKGRWRILKTGIRTHSIESADKIWLTCCALHNMLLDVDGLAERRQEGVCSDWEGEMGEFDRHEIPTAIQRLQSPVATRNYDLSGMGNGDDVAEVARASTAEALECEQAAATAKDQEVSRGNATQATISVKRLSMRYFKKKLIEHFDIAFQRHEVQWTKR